MNIFVTGKKAHTTLEMDDNVIYLNFEYVNLVSSCLYASQTWSTKVRKVDFTALNRLTRLQRWTTDSIDQFDFRQLFRLNSTPTSNDRLDRSISGSTTTTINAIDSCICSVVKTLFLMLETTSYAEFKVTTLCTTLTNIVCLIHSVYSKM